MNILRMVWVGRPAVSRYHKTNFYDCSRSTWVLTTMFMTALADRRAHGAQTWGLHASHTGEDIAEEEMFSADEQRILRG